MDEQSNNQAKQAEKIVIEANPLTLDLDDRTFVEVFDDLVAKSRAYFNERNLTARRQKNEDYFLGKQIEISEKKNELKKYNARYLDNVIYESEKTLKAVAVSRVPDLIVKAGNDTEESRKVAEDLTEIINSRFRKRETREVLGIAYTHRPIYFVGVIKARWDDEKGRNGDYVFENIHPNNIEIDHTAVDLEDMNWIVHYYELTVKEILMRWPNKKDDLFGELHWGDVDSENEKKMATKLKIAEIWFTWYKKEGDKWTRIEGTAWKYGKCVFDKIKNPYWDWEGETQLFTYDVETKGKRRVEEDEFRTAFTYGIEIPNLAEEKVYHNHFEVPRKPFILMTYDNIGLTPYDETSRIEQSQFLQDNVNIRGKQITELAGLSKGKNVFSTESGLTAADVAAIDMADPNTDLLVDGEIDKVHRFIPGTQPSAALFQDQEINRERLFSKMGTNAALRGVRGGENTATQTQLFKESDYTRIDDEVEETINKAAEQMADWAMQFMKLFYTEEHITREIGENGNMVFSKMNRDLIEDGMEVEVSASSVDKLRRKKEAFDLAGMGLIDPLNFFRDIEASDPEGRTRALMLFQQQPQFYFQKYVEQLENSQQMAQQLGQVPLAAPETSPEAAAVQPPQETELPPAVIPTQPSPYTVPQGV